MRQYSLKILMKTGTKIHKNSESFRWSMQVNNWRRLSFDSCFFAPTAWLVHVLKLAWLLATTAFKLPFPLASLSFLRFSTDYLLDPMKLFSWKTCWKCQIATQKPAVAHHLLGKFVSFITRVNVTFHYDNPLIWNVLSQFFLPNQNLYVTHCAPPALDCSSQN